MKKLTQRTKMRLILYSFYVLIALLPFITFISSFSNSLQYLIDREIEVQAQLADKSMNTIHSSLQYADSYTSALTSTGYVQPYISAPGKPGNQLVFRMMTMHDVFPILSDQNKLITRTYIYSRNSDSIIDRYSAYLDLKRHYEKIFRLGDMTQEEWKTNILQSQAGNSFLSTLDEKGREVLLYSRQLPVYPSSGGRIIFYLDADLLHTLLNGSSSEEMRHSIALYDENGSLLLSSNPQQVSNNLYTQYGEISGHLEITGTDGNRQILLSTSLPDYGFTLYTGIPKAYFTNHALRMSAGTLRSILPITLISLVLLFFILRYSHQPLRAAISFAPETPDIKTLNPFKYVQQAIMHLSNISQEQELMLQNSRLEMKEAVLSMLVYQKITPNFPLEEKLAEYGINYDADCFRSLILVIRDPENKEYLPISSQMHMVVLELAKKSSSRIRYVKMDGPDRMLFLALLDDSKQRNDQLQASLSRLCWEINQTMNSDVRIYVGCETESIEDVYYSFKSARDLMMAPGSSMVGCLVFSQPQEHSPVYNYASEDAHYLRQKANMGDTQAVYERLNELYHRNNEVSIRSGFERQLMYSHMISTLLEAGYQGTLANELTRNLSELPLDRFFELLKEHYSVLCLQNQYSEQQEEQQLVCSILAEIQNRLGDYDLTQTTIAMQFGLTERKVAIFIHEQTGMTFPKYLEKQRIEKSIDLLHEGKLTIEEIAHAVGYGSDKSFRRAFKKVTNCPPSAYKL